MSYTLAWILKCLKLYPSISLIDDSAAATQPVSRSARVADAATQPLCQSGWSSHSATQPLCQSGRRSHSATLPERLEEQPLRHSATQPLCRSGWRSSHSATQLLCQSSWSSHSATLPEWLEQPLSHSATLPAARVAGAATLPEWLTQPLCHSPPTSTSTAAHAVSSHVGSKSRLVDSIGGMKCASISSVALLTIISSGALVYEFQRKMIHAPEFRMQVLQDITASVHTLKRHSIVGLHSYYSTRRNGS